MKKVLLSCAAIALALAAGIAAAQYSPAAPVPTVNPTDQVGVIVKGVPTAQSQFATIPQIAGAPGYQNLGTILTGNTYTFGHAVTDMFAQAAGTLTAEGVTTEANPSDGQRECWLANQAVTTLTITANTGQTIVGGVVAPTVLNAAYCWTYVGITATWQRSP